MKKREGENLVLVGTCRTENANVSRTTPGCSAMRGEDDGKTVAMG